MRPAKADKSVWEQTGRTKKEKISKGANDVQAGEQTMRKNNRTGKRLRLTPLILGGYGAFLGFGLAVIGLAEMKDGIGIVRFLMGLGLSGFGLLGIWDGVRDLVSPDKKLEQVPKIQLILTDTSGNKSSLVTPEVLQKQMDILAESEDLRHFDIQLLPPLSVSEHGLLKQILCIYHGSLILVAFFDMPEGGYRVYRKSTEPDPAVEWLKQLSAGSPDFSGWENTEVTAGQEEGTDSQIEEDHQQEEENTHADETDVRQENVETFWQQLLTDQIGQMTCWHQLLVIFGESWHDEHRFFSVRDVELAIEGIHEGKYLKAVLEWGTKAFDLFPGVQNDLMVICRIHHTGKEDTRFLAKEGTVTQVKFWLVHYLNHGFLEEMNGWADVTGQIESISAKMEKEERKGKKKHGKVF